MPKSLLPILGFLLLSHLGFPAKPPNILLIMADDIGLSDLSRHVRTQLKKDPIVETPNLDALAPKASGSPMNSTAKKSKAPPPLRSPQQRPQGHPAKSKFLAALKSLGLTPEPEEPNTPEEEEEITQGPDDTLTPADEKILTATQATAKLDLKKGQWYQLRVVIKDDILKAFIDGQLITKLKSPGIAHPTKSKLGMTVNGTTIDFDNFKVFKN